MRRPDYAAGGAGGRDQPGTGASKTPLAFFLGQTFGSEQFLPVLGALQIVGSEQFLPVFGPAQIFGSEQFLPVFGAGQTVGSEQFFPVVVFFDFAAVSKAWAESRISR